MKNSKIKLYDEHVKNYRSLDLVILILYFDVKSDNHVSSIWMT